jgi:hypothetical protein
MIETVGDKRVLSDPTHTVELYYLAGISTIQGS